MDRRTVVLGVAAAAAVTAAIVVSLPHHHKKTARDDVAAYITQVNDVQIQLQRPLSRVSLAYLRFTQQKKLDRTTVTQLHAAQTTLLRLRRRIANLATPAAAQKLRRLMLKLVADEAEVTGEVASLAHFLPSFDVELQQLQRYDSSFAKGLSAIHAPTPSALKGSKHQIAQAQQEFATASSQAAVAQADVVDAYDANLGHAISRLQKLDPPPAFTPTFRAEIRALRATAAAGSKLAAELRKPQRPDVAKLSLAFTEASRQSRTLSAQRAEITAIKAYDARVKALATDASAVHSELLRLQATLP